MKTRIILIIGILLFSFSMGIAKISGARENESHKRVVKVFTSQDLVPLTTKWVREFSKLNPGMDIALNRIAEQDIAGKVKTSGEVGFISDQSFATVNNQFSWIMVVGRNVIVPVMNENNPFRDELNRKGITPQKFALLLENPGRQNWGNLLGNVQISADHPVHYYFVNDPSIHSGLADFVNLKQLKPAGIQMANGQELLSAIRNDPYGLAFFNLAEITDQQHQRISSQVKLVPIDKNGNGKVDYAEAIYTNLQEFSRGVWIGKYPRALSGKIYAVSDAKPKNEAELSFLNWVLTHGQQFLNANGYSDLVISERQSQLDKINTPKSVTVTPAGNSTIVKFKFLIILAIGLTILVMELVVRRIRNKKRAVALHSSTLWPVAVETEVRIPKGLYFDKTHTWAFMKKDGLVKIGIDDFLLHITGPLTRINLKKPGSKIKKGEHLLTIIQKGKQLNIYSPITGTIAAINSNLLHDTTLLNTAPLTAGWLYQIEPTDWLLEIQFLSMAEKYTSWLKTEYARLKDFFASAVRIHVPVFAMVLQDGGVLRNGILADLGPEVWDDFQTQFIDSSK